MIIKIILTVILIPACLSLVFALMQKKRIKISKTMSDKNFTVMIPNVVLIIGAMCALMSLTVLLCFTFFSDEIPHYIFYVTFGFFIWGGMYLIIKTLTFKVNVKGELITVYSFLRKPYSFTFSDIVSAVRQVKNNQVKSEIIVIKTCTRKRLVVESAEIAYVRFRKKIQSEVKSEYLIGFEE